MAEEKSKKPPKRWAATWFKKCGAQAGVQSSMRRPFEPEIEFGILSVDEHRTKQIFADRLVGLAKEYNLSRSLLQSPDLLWSPEEPSLAAAGAAGQFRNCLLLTDDQRLVACGLDRVSVRSLETGLAEEVLLPEAQWPMSNALAAGSPWLVLLRGHTLLLLHLGTAGASPRVWSRATVSAELGEVVAANWVEGFVEILFVQATSSALPSYRLTFVRSATTEDMEDLVLETVSHCFGSSPPLAASICNGRCLILSNGSYELERSAPPELDPNALGAGEPELAADEVDEEMRCSGSGG
ncbi:unnamed protein product [Durusdinium trenchii]|uniref:Uncharacterized protein n=1 Tax=Durusdinium trenchii TaxID=1381693 RepID=A0ABP0MWJ0_9DINO